MNEFDRWPFEEWLKENNERAALAIRHGIPPEQVPELMHLYALENITGALKDVCSCLESLQDPLESLGECIEHPKQGMAFLNVVGDISMRS